MATDFVINKFANRYDLDKSKVVLTKENIKKLEVVYLDIYKKLYGTTRGAYPIYSDNSLLNFIVMFSDTHADAEERKRIREIFE